MHEWTEKQWIVMLEARNRRLLKMKRAAENKSKTNAKPKKATWADLKAFHASLN